jgi:selenocysteine lyase/cysteine desulfurase
MVFDKSLYRLTVPDQPGGGTVAWTNPWGGHRYFDDVETREDGGTPAFLQTIRAALAVKLKDEMGVENILARESHIKKLFVEQLTTHTGIQLLDSQCMDRLAMFSFYSLSIHFNLIVKLLNDRFGIQVRGGCSCAGTYGHIMLKVAPELSNAITAQIDAGDLTEKPGWVRVSLHPTMTDAEVLYISDAIHAVIDNIVAWSDSYQFDKASGEFVNPKLDYTTPGLSGFSALS